MENIITADLYIRVSTDEQADNGYSLNYQEEHLRAYCEKNGITVKTVYKEDYSAKTFNRPQIKKMLLHYQKPGNRPNLLLVTKWDRFSREISASYEMLGKLDKMGIETTAIDQPIDMNIPESQLMRAVYLAAPMAENLRRSKNVFEGMRKAKKEGRYMGSAPCGYKNITTETGNKIIVPDENAPIVKWAFEELSTGKKDIRSVFTECLEKGIRCSRAQFYKVVKNPVYCGLIHIPAFKNEEETVIQGNHQPIITEELFDIVQSVLFKKIKKIGYKTCAKPELPLRGFLQCPKCGRKLTGSASKGGSGIKHFYYHCSNKCKMRIPAINLNYKFSEFLSSFHFNTEVEGLYLKIIESLFGADKEEQKAAKAKNEILIEKYENQLKNMRSKMANNEISSSDYNDFKNDIIPILKDLKDKNIEVDDVESELKVYLKKGISLIKNISKVYDYAPLEGKQKIIRSIFKENIIFSENEVRTGKINDVVSLISSNTKALKDTKKKTEDNNGLQSYHVARTVRAVPLLKFKIFPIYPVFQPFSILLSATIGKVKHVNR